MNEEELAFQMGKMGIIPPVSKAIEPPISKSLLLGELTGRAEEYRLRLAVVEMINNACQKNSRSDVMVWTIGSHVNSDSCPGHMVKPGIMGTMMFGFGHQTSLLTAEGFAPLISRMMIRLKEVPSITNIAVCPLQVVLDSFDMTETYVVCNVRLH